MRRPQLSMRTLLVLIALSAVLMSLTVGVVRWREAMRPLWDTFESQAASWEASERGCINRAALAEQNGDTAKAQWYRELTVKYAQRKRDYRGRWW